jgi:hypothetical protein
MISSRDWFVSKFTVSWGVAFLIFVFEEIDDTWYDYFTVFIEEGKGFAIIWCLLFWLPNILNSLNELPNFVGF